MTESVLAIILTCIALYSIHKIFTTLSFDLSERQRAAAKDKNAVLAAEILCQVSKYCIDRHSYQLSIEKSKHTKTDPYGLTIDCGWSYAGDNRSGIGNYVKMIYLSMTSLG